MSDSVQAAAKPNVRNYLRTKGRECPFCGNTYIWSSGSEECDGPSCEWPVQCERCGAEWDKLYQLNNIKVTKQPLPSAQWRTAKRAAIRRVMRKQAGVKNVYEAVTMQLLSIANKAAVNPLRPAQVDTSYGWAGAHIEGEAYNSEPFNAMLPYALDVYWTGKKGVVAIVVSRPDGTTVDDDIEFSGRRSDSKDVAKKAQDLLFRLRGRP